MFIATYAAGVLMSMANDKPEAIRKRLSLDLGQALMRDDAGPWPHVNDVDLALMADSDAYHEHMFLGSSAGPPSIHSSSSRPNPYQTYDPSGMDGMHPAYGHIEAPMDLDPFEHGMEPALPQPQTQQMHSAWYDSDL